MPSNYVGKLLRPPIPCVIQCYYHSCLLRLHLCKGCLLLLLPLQDKLC